MDEEHRDVQLQAFFDQAQTSLPGNDFVQKALAETLRLQRRAKIQRISVGMLIFLAAIPLQDFSLEVSQMLMVSLIDLPENIATILLAPVNSLGGVLTAVLFCLRLTQKRLYR